MPDKFSLYWDKIRLHGIQVDIATLKATNHNGRNNKQIATLSAIAREIEARLPAPPPEARLVSLSRGEKVVRAVVPAGDAAALFGRWAAIGMLRHGGVIGGMVVERWDPNAR